MIKLKRLGSFCICFALLPGYVTSAAAQKPKEDPDEFLKFSTEQKLKDGWDRRTDVPQLIKELVAYREKYGPSPNIDFMLATSYCRVDETRSQGVKLFRWMLNYYRFDASSRRLLKQAMDTFLIPSKRRRLGIDFQKQSRGWVVVGPARIQVAFHALYLFKTLLEESVETGTVTSVSEVYALHRPSKDKLLTALFIAASRKDPEGVRVLKFLLDQETSISERDRARVLARAAADGSAASVSLLIAYKVDLTKSVYLRSTFTVGEDALTTAAGRSDAEGVKILEILYKNRINLNAASTIDGDTALLAATRTGTNESVKFLLENGAKPDVQFGDSLPDVDFEFDSGAAGIIKVLGIDSNVNETELYEAYSTPLMFAAGRADADGPIMIGLLLKHSATKHGFHATKALMNAATTGNIQNLTALLDGGVPINGQNEFGATALMIAAEYGETEAVAFLMQRGADSQIKNRIGQSALALASHYGYADIEALLRKAVSGGR